MTIEPDAPADTSMMRITHQALRRDLDRTVAALRRTPPPADRQRSAIAEHLSWAPVTTSPLDTPARGGSDPVGTVRPYVS